MKKLPCNPWKAPRPFSQHLSPAKLVVLDGPGPQSSHKKTTPKSPVNRLPSSLPLPSLSSAWQGEYQSVDGMSLAPNSNWTFQKQLLGSHITISTRNHVSSLLVSWFHVSWWFHHGFMVHVSWYTCMFIYIYKINNILLIIMNDLSCGSYLVKCSKRFLHACGSFQSKNSSKAPAGYWSSLLEHRSRIRLHLLAFAFSLVAHQ